MGDVLILAATLAKPVGGPNAFSEDAISLQKVLDAPLDPVWAPEDREWKQKARTLLASLR